MSLTLGKTFDNVYQTGMLAVEALENTACKPFVEHVHVQLAAIDKQLSLSKRRKKIWSAIVIYRALSSAARAINIPGAHIAIRAQELMLQQLGQHVPKRGRSAVEVFNDWNNKYVPKR